MNTIISRLAPLHAWLILACAVAVLFSPPLEIIFSLLGLAALLSLLWLPPRRTRSSLLVVVYLLLIILALIVPVPLPVSLPLIIRLIITLGIWTTLLCLALAGLLYFLFRSARPNQIPHHPGNRQQQ